ncbi:MAG: hypothetical protein HYU51_09070 [Candidatus Rokubacteria bacterium]|nr:hypothetical protein [Candidatus Rokubacteria bacterium]
MTPDEPPPQEASGNGQPKTPPRWAARNPKPPAAPLPPGEHQRLAERRLLDEMARHRRAEQQQMQAVKWGCIGVLSAMVLVMAILFLFF